VSRVLEAKLVWRALAVWFAILLVANLNGAFREAWLIPRFGQVAGRTASTLILCGVVFVLTWLTIGWIGPGTSGNALKVGALWLGLSLAFEFLAGHFVFRQPWAALLEDYDLSRGRIWVLVLAVVLLAPLWSARLKGLLAVSDQ
jgi:hypothetical protein